MPRRSLGAYGRIAGAIEVLVLKLQLAETEGFEPSMQLFGRMLP